MTLDKNIVEFLRIKIFNIDGEDSVSLKDFGRITGHSSQNLYKYINKGNRYCEKLKIIKLDEKKFMIPLSQMEDFNFVDSKGRNYCYNSKGEKVIKSYNTGF